MNPKGSGMVRRIGKQLSAVVLVAAGCSLLTGCPHNDYTVELKPGAGGVERTLTFYRIDGKEYQVFPTNELAAITSVYPTGAVKEDGWRHIARGEFGGLMPADVGGNGHCTNLTTSLGSAGFYLERFRGHDDLVARATNQFAAADKIADLAIGWAKGEFGGERGWKSLRKFLDENVRHDLKNAGLYFWTGKVCDLSNTNAPQEFIARFGQYLLERGYIELSDLPGLGSDDGQAELRLVQKQVAAKMEIPAGEPLPKSLAILTNPAALEASWTNYLAGTEVYRTMLKEWKQKSKTDPDLKMPEPKDVLENLFEELLEPFNLVGGGENDHLTVKLSLARAPEYSNGRWEGGKVVWETNLEPDRALPVICYASWTGPDEAFQTAHFGKVVLDGDELTQYCLWRTGLDPAAAAAWEKFLTELQPGADLKARLEGYAFDGGPDKGRNLLVNALVK